MNAAEKICCGALLVISLVCFSSCSRKNKPVEFDNSDPLALEPDVQWAVVHDPYAAFRKDTAYDSEVTGHCRRADILRVAGMRTIPGDTKTKAEVWYAFDDGWLPESCVDIYSNKFKAKTAANALGK